MGHPFIDLTSGKRFKVILRKDTIYDIKADTLAEAQQVAFEEDYTKIIEEEVDYVRITDAWEVDIDGEPLPLPVDGEMESAAKE